MSFSLGPEEKEALLDLAAASVRAAVSGAPEPEFTPASPALSEPGAAFVTLTKDGALRGCIGHVAAHWPLWECVRAMARSAAIDDTRFEPVSPTELGRLAFEITVLTPLVPFSDLSEIEIGRDGLVAELGTRRGLLLPQVAVEWGFTRETFLDATLRKAGLPAQAMQDPRLRLFRFSGLVFGRERL